MDRMRGYSNLGARGDAPDEATRQRRLRALAERSAVRGRARLRLAADCAAALRRSLAEAGELDDSGDEALRRLRADAGRIEGHLRQARAEGGARTPASEDGPRVLVLARALAGGGERLLTKELLLREIAVFDAARSLEMRELQLVPAALRVALCEALRDVAADVLRVACARAAADSWVRAGGKGGAQSDCDEAFFERALQLSLELERPELHARIERAIGRLGQREGWLVERAHRIAADNCLRLDNLMKLGHLLDALNWRDCFDLLCPAELELRDDPAKVYAAMDEESRARVRSAVEQLARRARTEEIVVVRRALRAAREALDAHGADDPRASVCWHLIADEGRAALCRALGVRPLRRLIPDPTGRMSALLVAGLTAAALALCLWGIGAPALMFTALPLAWVSAWRVLGRVYPKFVKPGALLKLKVERVPDEARTLVALPVLLSSEARAREMVAHMETLGCLERDENIDYLLLGDFRDGDAPREIEDESILRAAREGIAALNAAAGREKYFYLHRARTLRARDARWMGENRKRGALMALNRLLLGREGAADAFAAEGARAEALALRYRYVVTLDQDTEYLPGTLQRLIGAMLHPMNRCREAVGGRRGYALLQPDMRLTAEAVENAYVELSAGRGGVDGYPTSVSDFYQDMTGRGCFAGKGIYDVRAFADATEGALDNDTILSHDLIEGILAGAGLLNDVRFYDGCPTNLGAELARLHRWTRGDWQLLPVLCSRRRMGAADRMKLIGNLLRSLYAPALLALLVGAVWLGAPGAFALGLVLAFLDPLLNPIRCGRRAWRAALLQLATLPAFAFCQLDAVLRTLWRLGVSRRHLMEWVTAADASGADRRTRLPGRVAALLALPGLLRSDWIVPVLGIAALFWVGAGWADDLARQRLDARKPLHSGQIALLRELAARTWRFFETFVPADGPGLPPDNVQLDPYAGAAMRTSPTNIGLYLLSCLAARELGLLSDDAMRARMAAAVGTMEGLEKWRGQLYNWYDLQTRSPLRPRYVSAVDSGNLAGALLLCAHALREGDRALARRMRALAEGMDLAALYDGERELFHIGVDVESGRASESHYDLYASEARILSFAAMMLGQAPVKHWARLNRASVRAGRGQALLSWSGTMFEYLMPELLLPSIGHTLAGRSCAGVAACQIRQGRRLRRPWGVSESGFYAFDSQLNYQYRAFGLRKLSLSGEVEEGVVAPYASALALCCDPVAAAENLRRMCAMGWSGEYGLYEAADYLRADGEGAPRLVRSHMAHHQGMALCAICNALTGDALGKIFMDIPEARALRLLLQEKPGARPKPRMRRRSAAPRRDAARRMEVGYDRGGRARNWAADVQLLRGAGTTALVTARGAAFAWSEGLQLNRFSGDLTNPHEGMYVHLEDAATGACAVIGGSGHASFGAGVARFREAFEGLDVEMRLAASPEDGALYQAVEIENPGGEARELTVIGCLAAALAPERDMRAHPAFQNLFVEGERLSPRALALRRRPRTPGAELPELIYLVRGGEAPRGEMRLDALLGRTGSLGMPGGLDREFEGGEGALLNPCAALRVRVEVEAKSAARLHFALLLSPRAERGERAARAMSEDAADRALRLAEAQARTLLAHAGLDGARCALYQRAAALLFDAGLRVPVAEGARACGPADRRALWSAGVSGELPLLLVELDGDDLSCAREGVRLHAFYRSMGVAADFVLLDGRGGDYRRNAGGELGALIAASHLSGHMDEPGGAHLLEVSGLGAEAVAALRRAAAIRLGGEGAPLTQLRASLEAMALRGGEEYRPMRAEAMPEPGDLQFYNGFGGASGSEYCIPLRAGKLPPAPWCNVIASERAGAVFSERGGGFFWFGNSRSDRLTPFSNDALREGWGVMFYLVDAREREYLRLLPGDAPMTDFDVRFAPGRCAYAGRVPDLAFETRVRAVGEGVLFEIELTGEADRELELAGFVDWRMGTDAADGALLRTWPRFGACFASGAAAGVGMFASDDPAAAPGCNRLTLFSGGDAMRPRGLGALDAADGGWTLRVPVRLKPGEARRWRFLLGCAPGVSEAYALSRRFRAGGELGGATDWPALLDALRIETPDAAVNFLAGGFLQAQALDARVRGRTGLYQPGGAYGFRDQLQDVTALLYYDPQRARRHLLRCAARQFEDGDVLHWWHEPYAGVRTRVSDDLLFLPWAAARYVEVTGDAGVLADSAPYLEDVEIPEGAEDVYAEMKPSPRCETLHGHCMRALRRAAQLGPHGLCRMGGGDWNDGMNRVGGESVWLSEFLAAVAADYARVAPDEGDRAWLTALNERLCAALEASAWDGEWYLRAFAEDGTKLGGRESEACRIDLISQAWAVLAGLDPARCGRAMDAAWEHLVDEKLGIVKLLDPPFDGGDFDPGYIAAYPPGIRENGAQYTHAACWYLCALIRRGDAARAHRVLRMLLPLNRALDARAAEVYRVEPYVMAADVYANRAFAGRGGWTWYTGAAGWMLQAILMLLGYERRGARVRLCALLGDWPEASVTVRFGSSRYRLVCRREVERISLDGEVVEGEFVEMRDDGGAHEAAFPPRELRENITEKNLNGWESVL